MHDPAPIFALCEPNETQIVELGNDRQTVTSDLHTGDLVETNRPGVNCRAWMSTVAPVRSKLKKGVRATLLSEPYRFGQHRWVKVRVDDLGVDGCIATRYLTLIERPAEASPVVMDPAESVGEQTESYRDGDRLSPVTVLNLRGGPGFEHEVNAAVDWRMLGDVIGEPTIDDAQIWVPVRFSVGSGWVAAQHTKLFHRTGKWLEVDLQRQRLTAWIDDEPVQHLSISSGKNQYATPVGAFTIREKMPVRLLRGTVRGESWEIPGVPWIMVFNKGGFYFHAAYWHNDFGQPVSHGCVTLSPDDAEWLYEFSPLGTPVWIHK